MEQNFDNGSWDLSFYYTGFDDPKIPQDMADWSQKNKQLSDMAASDFADTTAKLEALCTLQEEINVIRERCGGFCMLTLSVDATNTDAMKLVNRIQMLDNDFSMAVSAVTRFVGSIENLDDIIASSALLQNSAFALREAKEKCRHMLPEEIEPWILQMSLSGGTAFSQLRDKLDATVTADFPETGELSEKIMSLSEVRSLAYHKDALVRKAAYNAELESYKQIELPMSYCLNSIKMEARTLAKAKGYDTVLDMTLSESRMDQATLTAMWSAINDYLPDFRRYMKAKAHVLGYEGGLAFFDLFAPVGSATKTYTIDEARKLLVREMSKFTPEMGEFIDNAFEQHWIDLYPRVGKSGGAFCDQCHADHRSVVMTNFTGSFSDISTIAHELGHAWHNKCLEDLPYSMIDVPMPLAETASIFNETLLSHMVLQNASEQEEMTLLESGLMEATQTVVDIYSRFLFEQEVVDKCGDHMMSVDELKAAMVNAQNKSYGDGLDGKNMHPYMWACKSHYYTSTLNFYNFPYAFGLLFGKGVFAQYVEKGSDFVPVYCQLLRSCGSGSVADVAKSVGIDVHSKEFWCSSLEIIKKDIDRFCFLAYKQ